MMIPRTSIVVMRLLNPLGCGAWNVTWASCDKILISSGIPTWSTSADHEWEFSVHEHRFLNLMLMATVLSGSVKLTINELTSYIFYLSISEQAHECVFNENSIFQMVGTTRNTPNGFGASSSNDPPPPPPLTPTEALLTAQTDLLRQLLQMQ
jgi:hypothetical protein